MKQLFALLLALGFVASAAAIPAHAQQMQEDNAEIGSNANATTPDTDRGSVEKEKQPVRRGPPAFVQELMPEQALQNVPDFFW